jgi:hypothetical protein
MAATAVHMTPFHVALLVVSLHVQDPSAPARVECRPWQDCRQLALEAAGREDFETFHTLAWRAVQTGPKNDPDLMYLLARAQSLSGRPGDALVMLQRLTKLGKQTDAATNEDFRRVRALPGWTDTEVTLIASVPAEDRSSVKPGEPIAEPREATPLSAAADKDEARIKPDVAPAPAPGNPPPANRATRETRETGETREKSKAKGGLPPAESLRFTTAPFTPAGLAYDGVSRRFIVGDRHARKLAVVDEFSHHVANLASAQSSGFGDIDALEIDARVGNLWVVSNDAAIGREADARPQPGRAGQPTLHKLQLVSGRLLASYLLPERFGEARFVDVAATSDGTVMVLDTAGNRLFRLGAKGRDFELAATLPEPHPVSLAPASSDLVYVANQDGVLLVDVASGAVTPLKAAKGLDVTGITRLRWYKGNLVAVQKAEGGSYRAVRIALARNGRTAASIDVLDGSLATADPTAATVSAGMLYYLAAGDGAEMIVRKVTLQ